jgi:hypothetical protein
VILTNAVARPSARVTPAAGLSSVFHVVVVPADPERSLGMEIIPGQPARDGGIPLGSYVPGDYLIAALPFEDVVTLAQDRSRLAQFATVATRVTLTKGDDRSLELTVVSLPVR